MDIFLHKIVGWLWINQDIRVVCLVFFIGVNVCHHDNRNANQFISSLIFSKYIPHLYVGEENMKKNMKIHIDLPPKMHGLDLARVTQGFTAFTRQNLNRICFNSGVEPKFTPCEYKALLWWFAKLTFSLMRDLVLHSTEYDIFSLYIMMSGLQSYHHPYFFQQGSLSFRVKRENFEN